MKLADSKYDIFEIPIHQIWVDPDFNCRASITPESVEDLAGTIEREGLMFPVSVQADVETPAGYKYKLLCGFRRTTACKMLGWETIPANVRVGLTERQASLMNLQENLERKNLNILEEARALDKLFGPYRTDNSISTELKKNFRWVRARRRLLTMSDLIQQAAASGRLNASDLDQLATSKDPDALARLMLSPKITHKIHRSMKRKRGKVEVKELITDLLGEGFSPHLLRLLGWAIGEIDDEALAETKTWLRDRKGWLK